MTTIVIFVLFALIGFGTYIGCYASEGFRESKQTSCVFRALMVIALLAAIYLIIASKH